VGIVLLLTKNPTGAYGQYQHSADKASAEAACQAALDQDGQRWQRNRNSLRYHKMKDAADTSAPSTPEL